MIKNEITVDEVIRFLNFLVETDPKAIKALVDHRVPCNRVTAEHPSIQVSSKALLNPTGVEYSVGLLGLLNGFFGTYEANDEGPLKFGPITMNVDVVSGKILNFVRTDQAYQNDGTGFVFNHDTAAQNQEVKGE